MFAWLRRPLSLMDKLFAPKPRITRTVSDTPLKMPERHTPSYRNRYTKAPYNFAKVKARRKMARASRRANRAA